MSKKYLAQVVFIQDKERVELLLPIPLVEVGTNLRIATPSGLRLETILKSRKHFNYTTNEVEVPDWMSFKELIGYLTSKRGWVEVAKPEEKFFKKRASS